VAAVETLFIIPLSHTDIGFTAPPSEVAAQMGRSAALALELARADPAYVWNFETFWQFEQGLTGTAEEGPFVELLRAGRMGLSAAYMNPHSALMSDWALDRTFGLPVAWGRRHGLTLDWAMMNDVPGHPAELPRYLARHGVRFLVLGVNLTFSPPLPAEISNTPFWWASPTGERVLTWISADGYTEAFTHYGIDPATARFFNRETFSSADPLEVMAQGIGRMRERFEARGYPYEAALALFGFDNWGSEPARRLPEATRLWNEAGRRPRLRLATPRDFFERIEERHGPDLPVHRGGFGGQWEVVRTGLPTAIARARAEERRLALATDPAPADVRRLLVFWEHSFGMGPPWPKLLRRDQALLHNREQWEMIARWELPPTTWPQGEPFTLNVPPGPEALRPNVLYEIERGIGSFDGRIGPPLPAEAWTSLQPERLADGPILLRHRLDRRRLPTEAHVIWAWRLSDAEASAPVRIPLKSGEGVVRIEEEGLAGFRLRHWIASDAFHVGRTQFTPFGPFVFGRKPEHPGWLFAKVLDQSLTAEFKGEETAATMTFEEAYPGEAPVHEFALRIEFASDGRNP